MKKLFNLVLLFLALHLNVAAAENSNHLTTRLLSLERAKTTEKFEISGSEISLLKIDGKKSANSGGNKSNHPYEKTLASVTLSNLNVTYNDTNQAITVTTNPVGLSVNISYNGSSSPPKNAGTYSVVATVVDGEYTGSTNGTFVINKADLFFRIDSKTRPYGEENPDFTATYIGFLGNDNISDIDVRPVLICSASAFTNVLNPPTPIQYINNSAHDDNYNLIPSPFPAFLTVTRAILTVTADDKTKLYGEEIPPLPVSYTGFKLGQTQTVLLTAPAVSTTATQFSNVGSYEITVAGGVAANYSFVLNDGVMTVEKAPLIASADNKVKKVGDVNPELTISYSGFLGTDDLQSIDNPPIASTIADEFSPTGLYPISLSTSLDNNYEINTFNGEIAIVQDVNLGTTAQINISGTHHTYDGIAKIVAVTTVPSGLTTSISYNGSSLPPTNAGQYQVDVTIADNVYVGTATTTLVIDKAPLNVVADNKTKMYGDPHPLFTSTYSGFVPGEDESFLDTPPVVTTLAQQFSDVGNYSLVTGSGSDDNYSFIYESGQLTIEKAYLSAVVDNKSKTYGAPIPELTITYYGFKGGDNVSVIDSPPTIETTATESSPVVPPVNYPITAFGGVDNNYNITYITGYLSVTKALLTAVANQYTKTYGDPNPTFYITYTGFQLGEDESVLSATPPGLPTNHPPTFPLIPQFQPVGHYPIYLQGGHNNNYNFFLLPAGGALTVTKAPLIATADNKSKVYGDDNPTLSISYSGFKGSQGVSSLDSPPQISTNAAKYSDVAEYAIILEGGTDDNYDISLENGLLSVIKAPLTVVADHKSKIYGELNPELTYSYLGFVGSDDSSDLDIAPTISTSASQFSDSGEYPIEVTIPVDNNYLLTANPALLSIEKASLTVKTDDKTKVYGELNPSFTEAYLGFVGMDDKNDLDTPPTFSTVATQFSPVGEYDIIVSTPGSDNNYDIVAAATPGKLIIDPAPLQIIADDKSKIYGEINPNWTFSYIGFKGPDNPSVINSMPTVTTTANQYSNRGSYPISLSGGSDDNYSISTTDGVLSISKATLIATADNKSKAYGDSDPSLTITYVGFKGSDNASVINVVPVASTTTSQYSNVGSYPISLSGGTDNNYSISKIGGTLTISKATLTVTAANKSKTYGNNNPAFTLAYSGFKGADTSSDIDVQPTSSTTAERYSDVGSYPITPVGGSDGNYSFSMVNGALTINKRTLTVNADNKTKTYGSSNPVFTITYSGFVGGDNTNDINSPPSAASTASICSNAGDYTISVTGGSDNNYKFTKVNGILTINKASLTATVDNKSKVYGDPNPIPTISYSGFKCSDNVSVLDSQPYASTTASQYSDVGVYPITIEGGSDNNYTFSKTNGTLTISKADLLAYPDHAVKTYGDVNPPFTISYLGFKGSDNASSVDSPPTASTTATQYSNAASYPILWSGGLDNNYSINLVNNPGYLNITRAELTVTADNKTRPYGEPDPPMTLTYSGFKGSDDPSVIYHEPYPNPQVTYYSSPGQYPIFLTGGMATNYTFNNINGVLTIVKANQTISFDDIIIPCGLDHTTMNASASSGLPISFSKDDPESVTNGLLWFNAPGTVAITASQEGNMNYHPAASVTKHATWAGNSATLTATGGLYSTGYVDLTAGPGYDYMWVLAGNSGPNQQQVRVYQEGLYQVWYMLPNGCQQVQASIYVDSYMSYGRFIEGNSDSEESSIQTSLSTSFEFGLYPNPANHEVLIALSEESTADHPLIVSDLSGKVIMELTFKEGEKQKTVSLETLISGVYLVHVLDNGKMHYKKLIVKRE